MVNQEVGICLGGTQQRQLALEETKKDKRSKIIKSS